MDNLLVVIGKHHHVIHQPVFFREGFVFRPFFRGLRGGGPWGFGFGTTTGAAQVPAPRRSHRGVLFLPFLRRVYCGCFRISGFDPPPPPPVLSALGLALRDYIFL